MSPGNRAIEMILDHYREEQIREHCYCPDCGGPCRHSDHGKHIYRGASCRVCGKPKPMPSVALTYRQVEPPKADLAPARLSLWERIVGRPARK